MKHAIIQPGIMLVMKLIFYYYNSLRFPSSKRNDSADDTALNELLWYNVANDVILDLLSDRIRITTTSGVWK